jgi:hypothetical protein
MEKKTKVVRVRGYTVEPHTRKVKVPASKQGKSGKSGKPRGR